MERGRVLAYTLATELSKEEVAEVSGGGSQMTTRQTLKASGNAGSGSDVVYDVTVDW